MPPHGKAASFNRILTTASKIARKIVERIAVQIATLTATRNAPVTVVEAIAGQTAAVNAMRVAAKNAQRNVRLAALRIAEVKNVHQSAQATVGLNVGQIAVQSAIAVALRNVAAVTRINVEVDSLKSIKKQYKEDSHHSCHPENTVLLAASRLQEAGLVEAKAVIDISHLSNTGIPTFRPATKYQGNEWGKGLSIAQSQASALMELVERHSSVYAANEQQSNLIFSKASELGSSYVGFEDLGAANLQYFLWEEVNVADQYAIQWFPCKSWISSTQIFAPASRVFLAYKDQTVPDFACSNGLSASNTIEEAIIQGCAELIERHVYHTFYLNPDSKDNVKKIRLDSSLGSKLFSEIQKLEEQGYVVIANYHPSPLPMPTVSVLIFNPASEIEFKQSGAYVHFGTAPDPAIALIRCITESVQGMAVAQFRNSTVKVDPKSAPLSPVILHELDWRMNVSETISLAEIPSSANDDFVLELDGIIKSLRHLGLDLITADLTLSKLGIPVVRVLMPGLQNNFLLLGRSSLSMKSAITPCVHNYEVIHQAAKAGKFDEQILFSTANRGV